MREHSYGAVIYRIQNEETEFLLEKMLLGHVSLPKGHKEIGETPKETALREIKEELGLTAFLDMSFEKTITYSPKKGVTKDVTFFIATVNKDPIIVQKEEVKDAFWLNYSDAFDTLTHQSDKDVLRSAKKYIEDKIKKEDER